MIFSFEAVIPTESGEKNEVIATLDAKDLKYPVRVDDIPVFPIVFYDKETKDRVLSPYLSRCDKLVGVRTVLKTDKDTRSMYSTFEMRNNHDGTPDFLRQILATNVNLLWESTW